MARVSEMLGFALLFSEVIFVMYAVETPTCFATVSYTHLDVYKRQVPETPCFYLAKDIKKVGGVEMNKTMFTRMVGAFFCSSEAYAAVSYTHLDVYKRQV